jgi:hypothetical protein
MARNSNPSFLLGHPIYTVKRPVFARTSVQPNLAAERLATSLRIRVASGLNLDSEIGLTLDFP